MAVKSSTYNSIVQFYEKYKYADVLTYCLVHIQKVVRHSNNVDFWIILNFTDFRVIDTCTSV